MTKNNDLVEKTIEDLSKMLMQLKTDNAKIVFEFASGNRGRLNEYKKNKKMVARIKTQLGKREKIK